jgi:hypothetical protein
LHSEELLILFSSPNIITQIELRRMRWAGYVARMDEESVEGFSGKAEGKRPLERPRRRWEEGIRIDVREMGWGNVEWIQLAQNRGPVAGCCKYGDEHSGF